jgi:hypothetical protein
MRGKIRLILLFYRSWAFPSSLITAVAVWFLVKTTVELLSVLVVLKVAVFGLLYYFKREYDSQTLYYYTNRGISPKQLWIWSTALDMTIFVICVTAAMTYRYR